MEHTLCQKFVIETEFLVFIFHLLIFQSLHLRSGTEDLQILYY